MAALEVRDAPIFAAPGVAVAGEVDIATAPLLQEAVEAAIRTSQGVFVVDLADVPFVDSAGVKVLLRARSLLGREERELVLVCPPGPVLHALETLGIAELFAIFASRSAAARALVPLA